MVRVFAYGFGFTDRAAKYGALAGYARMLLGDKISPLPARIYSGEVRDLFEIAGLGSRSLLLGDLRDRWKELKAGLWEQRVDLFGGTPMAAAIETIQRRFKEEFKNYNGTPRSLLIMISDGESTDGSPIDLCHQILAQGTTIACGYITSSDVTDARQLYSEPDSTWPEGARTLFACSSQVGEEFKALSLATPQFEPSSTSRGWQIDAKSRLFLQLNQSEILSEFMAAILRLHTETRG